MEKRKPQATLPLQKRNISSGIRSLVEGTIADVDAHTVVSANLIDELNGRAKP